MSTLQRVCFLLKIRESMVEEYKKAHEPVWDEMRKAISSAGIRNYSIFIRKDGLLIGYFEADNPEESLRQLGKTEVNTRWQEHMAPYFEGGSGDMQKGNPEWLEQIFFLK